MLQAHFGPIENINLPISKPSTKSIWVPPNPHHTVQTFITAIEKDLLNNIRNKETNPNLSKEEINSLNKLKIRDDIIITHADIGGAVVIIDVNDYIKETNRQLSDTKCYTKLPSDLTSLNAKIINETINKFVKENLLANNLGKLLINEEPKTPKFYLNPKVHKENNPGRPVINSIDAPSAQISRFVDFHLQPIVQSIQSYVKDTTDFINKLSQVEDVPINTYLVTMDVKSSYTNIRHTEGIQSVAKALEDRKDENTSTRVIIKFLSLVLYLNNFIFNDQH